MDILEFKIRECFIRPDQEKAWSIIIFQKVKRVPIFLKHLSRSDFSHAYPNDFSKFQLKCFGQNWEMF